MNFHKFPWPTLLLLGLAALWGLVFFGLNLGEHLGLAALAEALGPGQAWQAWREASPLAAALVYVAVYVGVAALSLPGALGLTLLGGALFGPAWGAFLALLSATVGATLAMLLSRHLLGAWVARRWAAPHAALRQALARDGALALWSLRLVPLVPFVLLNLLMGLVPVRTFTFAWVSLVAMLPATLVYAHAGQALAQLRTPADLLQPGVLGLLLALAALPWVSRAATSAVRRQAQARRWGRPRRFERNLVVIGGGAGGLVTAYMAAALRARVTLVEAERLGGDCLHTGCVPSKALIHAARVADQLRQAHQLGLKASFELDWPALMQRVQAVVATIEPHDSAERYRSLGVEVLQGRARLLNPWTVEVHTAEGVQRLTSRAVVLATGARPVLPALPGLDGLPHATTETLWPLLAAAPELPRRIAILGGGPVGCELGQALARLGAEVTLIEQGPQLLAREDADVAEAAQTALLAAGVQLRLNSQALRAEAGRLWLRTPHGEEAVATDLLLLALGRTPRLGGLGLEALGLDPALGLAVDAHQQTALPDVYAVGDVAGPWQLTHAAAHQGWHAAVNALLGFGALRSDRAPMPQTLFLDPEIARVGLNERQAQAQGVAYELTRFDLSGVDRAIAEGRAQGFIKLLTVPGRDRLLGVTIVGPQAGELLAEYALALRHGLGLNQVLASIHAYPTLADANKLAAGAWKRGRQPAWTPALLARWHAWRRG